MMRRKRVRAKMRSKIATKSDRVGMHKKFKSLPMNLTKQLEILGKSLKIMFAS